MSLRRSTCIHPFDFQAILFWPDGLFKEPIPKKNEQNFVNITSVADPDPLESETFGRIRIRSGSEINILDPDSNPDPKLDPKQISVKRSLIFRPKKVILDNYGIFQHFQGII